MDIRNEVTQIIAPMVVDTWVSSQAKSVIWEGWVKKQTPKLKQQLKPEKGWSNVRDKQT